MANLMLEHDSLPPFWRETAAAMISPSTGFNRLAFGDRFKGIFPSHDPVYFSRLQIGFSGTAQNGAGTSTTQLQRNEALIDYRDRLRAARQAGLYVRAPVRLLQPAGDGVERERRRRT